jgi:hypothetical protein
MEIPDDLRYGRINYDDKPTGEYRFAVGAWIWRESEMDQQQYAMGQSLGSQSGLPQGLPNMVPPQWQPPISQWQPSVEEIKARELADIRAHALSIAFEHVKGDWQEAIRAARDILVFLQDG